MKSEAYENFIKNHVNRILINSEYQLNYIRGHAEELYEDEYLWCSIAKKAVSAPYFRNGLIFSGPEGSGKHSAAAIAVNNIYDSYRSKGKCGFIHISGNDIDFGQNVLDADFEYRAGLEFNENGYPLDIIELILDNLTNTTLEKTDFDSKGCIILFIDDDGQSGLIKKLYKSASYYLMQLNSDDDLPAMFVFAVTDDESEIPHCLRRDLTVIKMNVPDESERKKLIDIRVKDEELNSFVLGETQGMSMAELKSIIEEIYCRSPKPDDTGKEAEKAVIKRLADSIKYRPVNSSSSPVVISSGGGSDPSALISAMEKMGESISRNITANMPNQLDLNSMPDDLRNSGDGQMDRPDPMKIAEEAQNSTWRDFCSGLGLDLDDLSEEKPSE